LKKHFKAQIVIMVLSLFLNVKLDLYEPFSDNALLRISKLVDLLFKLNNHLDITKMLI
jgi:hypothetical protein